MLKCKDIFSILSKYGVFCIRSAKKPVMFGMQFLMNVYFGKFPKGTVTWSTQPPEGKVTKSHYIILLYCGVFCDGNKWNPPEGSNVMSRKHVILLTLPCCIIRQRVKSIYLPHKGRRRRKAAPSELCRGGDK